MYVGCLLAVLFISQWSSIFCSSTECPAIPSSPDELARHNGRCCVWTICKPGFMPEMCDEGDTKTTKCSPCPHGQFISNSFESYRMMICSLWGTPCASPEKKTVGGGNSTHDYICECNVDEGYIEDPSTPGVCKNVCPAGEQMDDYNDNICNPCQNGTFKLRGGARCEPCSSCVDTEFECNRTHDRICKAEPRAVEPVPKINFNLIGLALAVLLALLVLLVFVLLYVYIRRSDNCTCLGINLYARVHSLEKRICFCCFPRNVNNGRVVNDDEAHVEDQLLNERDSGKQESLEPCRLGESNVDDPNGDNTVRLDIDNQNQAIRDDSTDTRLKEIVAQTENESEETIEASRSVTAEIDDTAGLKEHDRKLNNMLDAANQDTAIPNYSGRSYDGSQNKRFNEDAAGSANGSDHIRQTYKLDENIKSDNDENENIGRRVRKYFDTIVASLDPKDRLIDKLFAEGIITDEILSEINDITKQQERCRKLLIHLQSIKHPKRFIVFLESAEKEPAYKYLVDLIKED